jgi:hypothetical protein
VALATASVRSAHADEDDTSSQFWPELETYLRFNDQFRVMGQIEVKNSSNSNETTLGIFIESFVRPVLRRRLSKDPDAIRRHYFALRAGYRNVWSVKDAGPDEQERRGLFDATARAYVLNEIVLIDRNRFEARDINHDMSWRYRNRLRIEREIEVGSKTLTPFAHAEYFWDSRYDAWSRRRFAFGVEVPLRHNLEIEGSYVRQNDTRSSPAHVNTCDLTFSLFL